MEYISVNNSITIRSTLIMSITNDNSHGEISNQYSFSNRVEGLKDKPNYEVDIRFEI